ncbi:MAG: S-layer homology domain-containing protein [Anaerocolumna sp.]
MKKMKQFLSLTMAAIMVFTTISIPSVKTKAAAVQDKTVLADSDTTWKYLDDNTDPAEAENPAVWTLNTYNDETWKTGKGSFGSKGGNSKDLGGGFVADNLLQQYIDGTSTDIPAYFFRTTFNIDSMDDFEELTGEMQYDDAAIVYINGVKVAEFDVPEGGYPSNMSYGGSNDSYPRTGNFSISSNDVATGPAIVSGSAIEAGSPILVEGENVMAVELHQGRSSSSDIFLKVNSVQLIRSTLVTDGFDTMEAEGFDSWSGGGLKTEGGTDSVGGALTDVGGTYDSAWLQYNDRYFEEAPSSITFRYVNNSSRCASDARMELRLDGADGELLQTVELSATGSNWNAYSVKTVDLTNTDEYLGKHNICFVMKGTTTDPNPYIINLDYIQFNKTAKVVTQKAVSLTIGEDETKRNITWYADDTDPGSLELALKSDMTGEEFPTENYREFTAEVQSANDTGFYSNQLTMDNLTANTEYVYRLINKSTVSKVYNFKTGDAGDFSFLFAGDPQIGASGSNSNDSNGWDNTLTQGLNQFPETDFIVSAGDQVNSAADESQYAGYLNHDALSSIPIATIVGNHDTASSSYSQHFNNPNVSSYGVSAAGSDYWYVYNNVLFLNLNSNNLSTAEHRAFMEDAISANPDVTWKVVVFHHSIYSVANHATESDILQRREEYSPVFKDLGIDVVLMGHDHVYVRSYMMDGLTPEVERNADNSPLSSVTDPDGTLYVTANSASGSKFYTIQNQVFPYSAVQSQENVPNISNVSVSPTSFKITTYRVNDMSTVDTFEIIHTKELTGVMAPEDITGVANGTEKTVQALGLPETVTLTTDEGNFQADVQWDVASSTYDTAVKEEQTFTVKGTVILPDGVGNPDNISLDVTINVTVNKAAEDVKTLLSIKAPSAVTGIKNGTAKTADALKLPKTVILVTDKGDEAAQVTWDVVSSSYITSDKKAQTFTVTGEVTLPEDVVNTDNIDLATFIRVSVKKKASSNSGSSNSGSSSSTGESTSGNSNSDNGSATQNQADVPVTENVTAKASVDKNGLATADVSETAVTDAIAKAVSTAKEQGKTEDGVEIAIKVDAPDTANSMDIVLTQPILSKIAENNVQKLKVDGNLVSLNFNQKALEEIRRQSTGTVKINIKPVESLSEEAKAVIKDRQVYDIDITYVKSKKTQEITKLGQGIVSISIPYTPAKGEDTGKLYAVYVDDKGKANMLAGSSYDANTSSIIFTTGHFSVYGVAYQDKAGSFTDIVNHPAKESIDFVTSRGILKGTANSIFSPNTALSFGILAKALVVLDGVDISIYKDSSFTDLDNNQYKQYIEWAYQKGIMAGEGKKQFAPDRIVTREQFAVIMENYAKATEFVLPKTREAISFNDTGSISLTGLEAIKSVQQAGIMDQVEINQFKPLKSVTYAEAALILHRYAKLVIDPQTAQGWALSDSGQKMYYKDGKALTGWQNLNNNWYYFYSDGSMAVNTSIGEFQIDNNGIRISK